MSFFDEDPDKNPKKKFKPGFDPRNSNSFTNPFAQRSSSSDNGGGGGQVPLSSNASTASSGSNSEALKQLDSTLAKDFKNSQLVTVNEDEFRNRQIQFSQDQLKQIFTELASLQAQYNAAMNNPNEGERNKIDMKRQINDLRQQIAQQTGIQDEINSSRALIMAQNEEFRKKNEALDKTVIDSQNRLLVELAAESLVLYINSEQNKRGFNPETTKAICDDIITQFTNAMNSQGQAGWAQQNIEWITAYLYDVTSNATSIYRRAMQFKGAALPAAAAATLMAIVSTNIPSAPISTIGVSLANDAGLLRAVSGEIINRTGNAILGLIYAHPVATVLASIMLLISAYNQLSQVDQTRLGEGVKQMYNQLLNYLQQIISGTLNRDNWKQLFTQITDLMSSFEDAISNIPNMLGRTQSSSSNISIASSQLSQKSLSVANDLLREGITEQNISQIQEILAGPVSRSNSNMSSGMSSVTMSPFSSQGFSQSPSSSPRIFEGEKYSAVPTSSGDSSRTSSIGSDFFNDETVRQTGSLLGQRISSSGSKSFGSYQQSQNLGQKRRTTETANVVTVVQGPNGALTLNKEIEVTDADRSAGIVGWTVTAKPILNVSDEESVVSSLSGNASTKSIHSVTVSIRNQQGQQQDITIPVINGFPQQPQDPVVWRQLQGVWPNLQDFINRWVFSWNSDQNLSRYSTDSSSGGRRRRSRRYKSRRYTKKRHYRKHRNTRRRPRRNTKKRGRK
jgi:hypothetical protein